MGKTRSGKSCVGVVAGERRTYIHMCVNFIYVCMCACSVG